MHSDLNRNEPMEFFDMLFNSSLDAVFLSVNDGKIQMANPAACNLFGRTVEEFCAIGRAGVVDEEDPRFIKALEESSQTGRYFGELTGLKSDGSRFPIEVSSTLFTDKGGNSLVITLVRDITARKSAERALKERNELLSLFIKHSPIYSYIKEVSKAESRVLFASENYIDMIGVKGSDMVGKDMFDLFPADFAKKITADDFAVVESCKMLSVDEDLGDRNYITIKFPISQEDKTYLAGYTIDITDLRRSENVIRENETRLRELNATKDKFFSIIAHDIRGPFSSIIGFSHLLVDQMKARSYEDVEKYAEIILKSSEGAMELLKNLQVWSSLQTGKILYKPLFFDLSALVKEVVDVLIITANLKSIQLINQLPKKYIICGDEAMISTILRNLISNALKFTKPGGKVVISAEDLPDVWRVSVTDSGIGIKEDELNNLFRIESTHSRVGTQNEKGTGLGLILCKDFIELHKGKIWVESVVDKGSTFFFTIPKCI